MTHIRVRRARFRLREAAAYLGEPMILLVESRIEDGGVICDALKRIDADLGPALDEHRWIRVEHGGGKEEILRQINRHYRPRLAGEVPPVIVVVVDGDRREPGDEPATNGRLRAVCRELDVSLHILDRRELENYLSAEVLHAYAEAYPDQSANVAIVQSLTDEQRKYFPVKKGFVETPDDPESLLYAGSPGVGSYTSMNRLLTFAAGLIEEAPIEHVVDPDGSSEFEGIALAIRERL